MPRARGGRGRGRAVTPVADGSDPRAAFEARKARLMERAQELEDVVDREGFVAMVCSGIDGLGGVYYWPSVEEAMEVVELFHDFPEEMRSTEDHANYVTGLRDAQRSKLAKVREDGIAAVLGPRERDLDGMPEEALQGLLASIEVSREAARSRIRERQPQPDESVAENLVAGEEDASGEVQGAQKQPQGANEVQGTQNQPPGDDDNEDDAAWPWFDLDGKPEEELLQGQPHESVAENLVASEENASGEVQGTQNQPQGADEVQGTQNQPQGADEVQGPQKPPAPGYDEDEDDAPYQPGPHEYINVGGYLMERDAYDYIRYDLTMFTPYYGLPPRLWPWGAPPPPN